jgi:hypothetical protein
MSRNSQSPFQTMSGLLRILLAAAALAATTASSVFIDTLARAPDATMQAGT